MPNDLLLHAAGHHMAVLQTLLPTPHKCVVKEELGTPLGDAPRALYNFSCQTQSTMQMLVLTRTDLANYRGVLCITDCYYSLFNKLNGTVTSVNDFNSYVTFFAL